MGAFLAVCLWVWSFLLVVYAFFCSYLFVLFWSFFINLYRGKC